MIAIPDTIDEITVDWLTAALRSGGAIGCCVARAETTPMGESVGLLSTMVRCRLWYDAPAGGEPSSVVIKLEPNRQRYRAFVEGVHGFEREILFYRDVGPTAPIRLPRFYHGGFDPHRAVIVLEDLGYLRTPNQIEGLRNAEAIAAVTHLARLQASFWNNEALAALHWMPVHEARLTDQFVELWRPFKDHYGPRIGADAVALGRRLCGAMDWLRAEMAKRPRTICHCDFRADNLLFGEPAGPGDAPKEVAIIDWQIATQSLPTLDVARLLGGSEAAAEQVGHAMEVFTAWHDTLRENGVVDYAIEEAVADLRLAALVVLCVPVRLFSMIGPGAVGRERELRDAIATRMFASALEIGAAARLP